jgi:hypothetical protein
MHLGGVGERCLTFSVEKRKGKRPLMGPMLRWKDFEEDAVWTGSNWLMMEVSGYLRRVFKIYRRQGSY